MLYVWGVVSTSTIITEDDGEIKIDGSKSLLQFGTVELVSEGRIKSENNQKIKVTKVVILF